MPLKSHFARFFAIDDEPTAESYTLSLHDALPIWQPWTEAFVIAESQAAFERFWICPFAAATTLRSEEHTSELQSRRDLVCRLLLEKKKTTPIWAGCGKIGHEQHRV